MTTLHLLRASTPHAILSRIPSSDTIVWLDDMPENIHDHWVLSEKNTQTITDKQISYQQLATMILEHAHVISW